MSPYKGLHVDFLEDSKLLEISNFLDSRSNNFQSIKSKSDSNSSRDVLYFGEFKYRYGAIQHDAKAMLDIMQPITNKISELYPKTIINSCLITCYQNGRNHCPQHSENEPFIATWTDIFTLYIGHERSMLFKSINDSSVEVKGAGGSLTENNI